MIVRAPNVRAMPDVDRQQALWDDPGVAIAIDLTSAMRSLDWAKSEPAEVRASSFSVPVHTTA